MASMRHTFVNTDLIDKVITSIKKNPFDMRCWQMCICGHLLRIEATTADRVCSNESLCIWGAMKLGITHDQALDLFQTNMSASRREAVRCLEILRDEGVVDWHRATALRPHAADTAYEMFSLAADMRLAEAQMNFDRLVEEARALDITMAAERV